MSAVTMNNGVTRGPGPSALDVPLRVTFFQDHTARTKQEAETSLRSLIPRFRDTTARDKASLPWVKLATFGNARTPRGSLRHDQNMIEVFGIEADYDGENITLERARQIIRDAGLAAIIYTSPSHTKDAPRWRVLCPLSEPIRPEARAQMVARLNGLFVGALASESFTASQAYYYGRVIGNDAHMVMAIDGRAIDVAHELDDHAIGKPERPKAPPTPQPPVQRPKAINDEDGTPYGLAALAQECQAIRSARKGEKWKSINRAAYAIGGLVQTNQLREGPAYQALKSAVESLRTDCEDFDHAINTLKTGFEDGKSAPRNIPPPSSDRVRRVIFEYDPPPNWQEPPPLDEPPPHWDAEPEFEPPQEAEAPEQDKAAPLWVDTTAPDAHAIPKRPWVVPSYLMRGSVSVLSGPGAGGKSSIVVGWTIALATGQAINGFTPSGPTRVVNYNTEDDQDEQRRRYSAALIAQKANGADIANRIMRCGPHSIGTLFERDPATGRITPTAALQQLEDLCVETGAEVLICDPLAELHNAEENDNTAMRAVIAAFRSMAQRLGIAILILHHDRKGNNAPGDMDRVRGASAISGAVRVMMTLTPMTQEEADKFGIPPDQRRRHFRIDGAKSNYAPATEAEWWRLDGYEIPNGETVAAALPWAPPTAFEGISMETCIAILARIKEGIDGAPFGAGNKVRGELFSVLEGEPFNLPEGRAKAILAAWMKEGIVYEMAGCKSPNSRHPRLGLLVNETRFAEMRRQ